MTKTTARVEISRNGITHAFDCPINAGTLQITNINLKEINPNDDPIDKNFKYTLTATYKGGL